MWVLPLNFWKKRQWLTVLLTVVDPSFLCWKCFNQLDRKCSEMHWNVRLISGSYIELNPNVNVHNCVICLRSLWTTNSLHVTHALKNTICDLKHFWKKTIITVSCFMNSWPVTKQKCYEQENGHQQLVYLFIVIIWHEFTNIKHHLLSVPVQMLYHWFFRLQYACEPFGLGLN